MHPKQAELEKGLSLMCAELDEHLEDKYGTEYTLHPNRPRRGHAANPSYDGLFYTGAMFTLGYGSTYGRGYIIDIEIRSLQHVDSVRKREIEEDGMAFLKTRLKSYFPERELQIVRDKTVWKLTGDFSLGEV